MNEEERRGRRSISPAVRDESDGGGPAGAAPHAQEPQRAPQLQQGVAARFSAAAATATTAAATKATAVGSAVCDGSPVLIFGIGVSLFDGLRGRRRRSQRAPKPGDKLRFLIRAVGRGRSENGGSFPSISLRLPPPPCSLWDFQPSLPSRSMAVNAQYYTCNLYVDIFGLTLLATFLGVCGRPSVTHHHLPIDRRFC